MIKRLYLYYLKNRKPVKYLKKIGASIGEGTFVNRPVHVSEGRMLKIGKNCNISVNVSFYTHDGSNIVSENLGLSKKGYRICAPIIIGNNVFIGGNTIILPVVSVGDNVIIGAGSVVTKSIPSNTVVAGNPAKIISEINTFFEKNIQYYKSPSEVASLSFNDENFKRKYLK